LLFEKKKSCFKKVWLCSKSNITRWLHSYQAQKSSNGTNYASWNFILIKSQYTHKVTLRRVCANIVAMEKQWVLHNLSVCICSLRHPACIVHGLPRSTILSHKRNDFRKSYSSTSVWNISHPKKKRARYDTNVYSFSCKVHFILIRF